MIRYLKTFIAAAQLGSFSTAGARLGLTQSAVSMQIRRLEDELNCELFTRVGKSVTVSDHGKQLLRTSEEIIRLFESMKGQTEVAATRGKIDIGAISTVQLSLLPAALADFRKYFPLVEVNVVPGTSVQLMSQIDSNDLSLAIMIRPNLKMTKGLKWATMLRETYVAIAPLAARETSVRDLLAAHPFLRYSRRSYGGQLVDRYLKRTRLHVNDTMELDEPMVIMEMVRKGLGVAIIPSDLAAGASSKKLRVLPLGDAGFFREIGVLRRVTAVSNDAVDKLLDCISKAASAKGSSSLENLKSDIAKGLR
ncbi:DNA-binding transcriptional regulator, LysR family [Collimonas sp. OK607]|uniref:LysR family transcriptional regulator n=1 Tax=Collimonas sp. OK607 TaxID=1798194 RepID=UPI0008F28537|nr:LysR family transcriptional regulator [Collimonas sp. OK607]SFB29071.1 DNA-binding transcriptional regulator, LysR family [Collimonas sp. OK607]